MKKILIWTIIFLGLNQVLNAEINSRNIENIQYGYGIDNGWYHAIVKYDNYDTGTHATYKLNVKVENNNVVKIDFGNGGSVHSGYNNEGYIYSGGSLSFEKDYDGNITAATTTVSTSDSNGMRYFRIRIE